MAPESKLFCPYKAVGLVASNQPFFLRYLPSGRFFILKVPVGNAFHIYSASKLSLLYVSEFLPSAITCSASGSPHDYTATKDGSIYCWSAWANLVQKLDGHKSEVHSLVTIGNFLVSVDIENILKVWDTSSDGALYLETDFGQDSFDISVLVHPPAYLNKVLLGSKQGKLQLFNLKSGKVIYKFAGWGSAVTAIEPAPAIDVVAVGLDDGRIVVHNMKFDETIMTLKQDWGKVTALSFRSDNKSRLVSGSALGHVSLWDLDEKCLKSTIEKAHNGPIISLACAKGDPIAYSSSTDNVIKSWIFDMPDGGARLYVIRDGHSEPPLHVRFHGAAGLALISGGQDSSLRFTSMLTAKGKSMGLACYNRAEVKKSSLKCAQKMPAITQFTTEMTREEAWDSIAAVHLNCCEVTTWSFHKKTMNEHILQHKRFKNMDNQNAMTTCIEISACGNFVIIGYNTGHVDKYNIQSGYFKLSYGKKVAHATAVRGVVSDSLNHWVVSGDQDGNLQWWAFHKGTKDKTLKLEGGVSYMTLQRESGLFAVALDDWSITVADVDTKCVCRTLYGHHNQITDMAFSADSKWLVSASMDHSIRTWDIPTGSCIDHFNVPSPATSLSMSPIDDYLVTTHVDELGIYVWANRSCLSFVSLQPLKEDHKPAMITLPASAPDTARTLDDSDDSDLDEDIEVDEYKSPDQLSEEFVTLDLMPTSRWLNLDKIDQIKKRNKPLEAPKAPKSAPFFLESVAGVESKTAEGTDAEDTMKSKVMGRSEFILQDLSPFGSLLHRGEHDAAFHKLLKMGPSNIDIEIRNLDPDVGGSREAMIQFLHMIKNVIKSRLHFEVAQGYLALFMKRHSDFLVSTDSDIEELCKELASLHACSWHVLKDDINKSLSVLTYFKNSAILNY